jgi:foldase protein PrsA
MKTLKYILALGAFFVVAAGISACGSSSGLSGNAVAEMAGNPITVSAYKHWMFVAEKGNSSESPGSPVIVPTDPPGFTGCIKQVRAQIPSLAKTSDKSLKSDCKQLFTSLNATVMDFLVKAYWYQAEAHRLHLKITTAAINTAYTTAKNEQFKTQAAFESFLKETGQTVADIRFRVLVNLIFSKLEAMHAISTSPAAIEKYYTTHASQFSTKETRNIRIVRTKTAAAAAAAKAALASGQSWSAVAKKYSVDTATKDNGGLLSGVTNGQEETALNNAAFAAPVNKLEGVIHGTFGYYTFEVVKITPATHQSLTKATPLIKQLLSSENSTAEENGVNKVAKKYWFAKTKCRTAYAMADCSNAPKTTSTTPTTAGASTGATTAPATTAPATTSATPTTASGGSSTSGAVTVTTPSTTTTTK